MKRPSAAFLIISHALILLLLVLYGATQPLSLYIRLITYVPILAISLLLQLLVHVFASKRLHSPYSRVAAYYLPLWFFLFLGLVLPRPPQPLNKTQPLESNSKQFLLRVPIKDGVWTVQIFNHGNKLLYQDASSHFMGQFNAYWCWDKEDRVWLYNSDDSAVFFWEQTTNGWAKCPWGYGRRKATPRELSPPETLFPHYVKKEG